MHLDEVVPPRLVQFPSVRFLRGDDAKDSHEEEVEIARSRLAGDAVFCSE